MNPEQTAKTDILIIGAGASGAAAAWKLAGAGFRVVCLEQGDWHSPEASPTTRTDLGIPTQDSVELRSRTSGVWTKTTP